MKSLRTLLAAASMIGTACFVGCAASTATSTPACVSVQAMFPASATADHLAAAPGNSVQFDVGYSAQSTCAVPQVVYLPTLTTSDTVNVSLPSQGVAMCVGTTTVPATLTDTRSKATAQLSCK